MPDHFLLLVILVETHSDHGDYIELDSLWSFIMSVL